MIGRRIQTELNDLQQENAHPLFVNMLEPELEAENSLEGQKLA